MSFEKGEEEEEEKKAIDLTSTFDRLDKACFLGVNSWELSLPLYEALLKRDSSGWARFMCGFCSREEEVLVKATYFAKAVPKLRAAAKKKKCYRGYHGLAYCYEYGLGGLTINHDLALRHYSAAAKKGFFMAQCRMGHVYRKGFLGTKRNYKWTAQLYRLSIKQVFAPSQRRLARMYMKGKGVGKSNTKAARLFEKAVSHGDTMYSTLNDLSGLYYTKRASLSNYPRAIALAKLAVDKGSSDVWLKSILKASQEEKIEEGMCF